MLDRQVVEEFIDCEFEGEGWEIPEGISKDELVEVRLTPGNLKFVIGSKNGQAVKFSEEKVRPMGRTAAGVRGIRLNKGDVVVGLEVALEIGSLLTVTENGYGKRSKIGDYRLTNRGGKGVINIKTTERNGPVVALRAVSDTDELMLITGSGTLLRMELDQLRDIGRATQGVRLIRVEDNDRLVAVAKIITESEEAEITEEANGTAAAPAITGTDTDTGPFFGSNTIGLSIGGVSKFALSATALGLGGSNLQSYGDLIFNTGDVTLAANRSNGLITDPPGG